MSDTGAAVPTAPWHQGVFDAETLGLAQNKGWDLSDPAKTAAGAAKAYREAQAFVGVPADQLIKLPKDMTDEAGWKAVHQRLGKPADPKDYAFDGMDFGDDALTGDFKETMRGLADKNNLSKDAAAAVAAGVFKFIADKGAADEATTTAALETQKAALQANWGANFEANKFVAQQAAKSLGVDPVAVGALESAIGYDKVMEMFRAIGVKMGEDKYVAGNGAAGGSAGVMSRDAAIARKAEIMGNGRPGSGDQAFIKKYNAGDPAARREMDALNRLIVGA